VKISVIKKISCDVNVEKVEESVKIVLMKNGGPKDSEISTAITSDEELEELAARYMGESGEEAKSHPVLSFSSKEVKDFIVPKESKNYLGEIMISWEKAVIESKKFDRSAEDIVCDYAAHATLHLLGIHHK